MDDNIRRQNEADAERRKTAAEYNAKLEPGEKRIDPKDVKVEVKVDKDDPSMEALRKANKGAKPPPTESTTGGYMLVCQQPSGLVLPVFNLAHVVDPDAELKVYPPMRFATIERAKAWHRLHGVAANNYAVVEVVEQLHATPLKGDEIPSGADLAGFMISSGYALYDFDVKNWRHTDGHTPAIPVGAVNGKPWSTVAKVFGY